jgi:hypothetical protein
VAGGSIKEEEENTACFNDLVLGKSVGRTKVSNSSSHTHTLTCRRKV